MDIVFWFNFYHRSKDFSHALAFYVANINTTRDKLYETMALCAQKMDAQYGEHRRNALPRIGSHLIGYSSSEIPAEHHNHVMHAWRTAFLRDFVGCAVSDVYDVTTVLDNEKIFGHTKDLYEQQQAQQLRDTLTAHITISASPTAVKKI